MSARRKRKAAPAPQCAKVIPIDREAAKRDKIGDELLVALNRAAARGSEEYAGLLQSVVDGTWWANASAAYDAEGRCGDVADADNVIDFARWRASRAKGVQ